MRSARILAGLVGVALAVSGCAVGFYAHTPQDKEKITQLHGEVEKLKKLRAAERKQLEETLALLEKRLQKEIQDKQVRVEMAERGLVITFLTEILFDSGKAEIRAEGQEVLNKVVGVLREKHIDQNIGVEGHTDNEPIRYSGWKSNWELSTARATSVLHFLAEQGNLSPKSLSATGFGEFHPVESNESPEGRQKNRRVEVVILPKHGPKVRPEGSAGSAAGADESAVAARGVEEK